MSKQKETRFKEKVVKRLEKIDGCWFEKIQQLAKRGTPDILICCRGVFVAWELKVDKNVATPLQEYNLKGIAKAGGIARVVHPDNLEACIKELECLPTRTSTVNRSVVPVDLHLKLPPQAK